jgi:hypothetical protein
LAPETWSFRDLIAAGCSEADLEWESLTATAVSDLAAGRPSEAFEGFARALRLARTGLAKDDPRLATSLCNHAAALEAAGEGAMTGQIRTSAAQAWAECERWIASMTAPRTARSSLFHLRMERLHRPVYEERWRAKGRELLAGARAEIGGLGNLALLNPSEAEQRMQRWKRERPVGLGDPRKLLGAVILLAAREGGRGAAVGGDAVDAAAAL